MKKFRGLLLVLCPFLVGFIWVIISASFWILNTVGTETPIDPQLLLTIKSFANRWLGAAALVSLGLAVVGIILLITAKNTQITTKEAINYGWQKSKAHITRFLLWFGILIAVQVIAGAINPDNAQTSTTAGTIISIVVNIITLVIGLGLAKISLGIVYKREYKISDLFVTDIMTILKYIGAYILNTLIVFAGMILLIIPGIVRSVKLSLFPYLVLEKGYGPFKAIRMSWRLTKGCVWDMFVIKFIAGLINILWVLAVVIGLLWTIPLMMIANAYIYKRITEIHKDMLVETLPA